MWTSAKETVALALRALVLVALLLGGLAETAAGEAGNARAWGSNWWGQLGDGGIRSSVPVKVTNLSSVVAVASSGDHSLALKSDGTVWVWGSVPVRVSNLIGVTAISAGGHNLVLKKEGTVWAWGRNERGQLGNGTNTDSNVPVQVSNLTGVVAVAACDEHSLALRSRNKIILLIRRSMGIRTDDVVPVTVEAASPKANGGKFCV